MEKATINQINELLVKVDNDLLDSSAISIILMATAQRALSKEDIQAAKFFYEMAAHS